MDHKTLIGVMASLAIMGVAGGLAIYKEVGVLSERMVALAEDLKLRDLRERVVRDALIRLEERHAALSTEKRCP